MLQFKTTGSLVILTEILDLPYNEDLKKLYSEPEYTTIETITENSKEVKFPATMIADFDTFCDKHNIDGEKRSDFWNTVIRYWLFSHADRIGYDHSSEREENYFGLCFVGVYCCLVLIRADGTVGGHS